MNPPKVPPALLLGDEEMAAEEKAIGERVSDRMEAVNIDAKALATQIGVTEDTIHKLRQGKTVKQWIRLINIARALRTTPNVILGIESPVTRDRQVQLLTFAFYGLGLTEDLARNLTEIYLEALDTPPDPQSDVPDHVRLRISAETLKRQSGAQ